MMTKVVHDTDIGTGLEISGGKLNAAATMATDAEVAAAITAQDTAENTAEAFQLKRDLYYSRFQHFLQHNAIWELDGSKVKAHTVAGTNQRLISIAVGLDPDTDSTGGESLNFPQAGAVVKSLNGSPDKTVDANGFLDLTGWNTLWYRVPVDGTNGHPAEWAYSSHNTGTFAPDSSWIIVLQTNADFPNGGYRAQLSTGRVLHQGLNFPEGGDRIGGFAESSSRIGRRNIGVFEGLIPTRATNVGEGGFSSAKGAVFNPFAGTDAGNAIVHFKLPLRSSTTNPSNQMYHLHFQGYAYLAANGSKVIDFTVVGYAYPGLPHPEHYGSHAGKVTQYVGADGHVYVRVDFTNAHYLTVVIDSMAVGNGQALKHDSIVAIFDNAATL